MNWNQPICGMCWYERNPDRDPVRVTDSAVQVCAWCANLTSYGIYVRANPNDLPYPQPE